MRALIALSVGLAAQPALAFVNHDGASLGGYARLLARPDLAGGAVASVTGICTVGS